jgi:hypothetical protein
MGSLFDHTPYSSWFGLGTSHLHAALLFKKRTSLDTPMPFRQFKSYKVKQMGNEEKADRAGRPRFKYPKLRAQPSSDSECCSEQIALFWRF